MTSIDPRATRCRQVVAVDVGNSAAKLLLADGDVATRRLSPPFRIATEAWAFRAVQWIRELVTPTNRVCWHIASVHRAAASALADAIAVDMPAAEVHLVTRHTVPIVVRTDVPDRVGIDRVLGAYAASRIAKPPMVVIDAGSAVTVDWVNAEGEFCGGAILPGLRLQSIALATGTDALPNLDWSANDPLQVPGRNTENAIRLGVVISVAAAIDRLVQLYSSDAPSADVTVVLTGGDAASLSTHIVTPHRVEPNLVCHGLLALELK